jgi:hypothetical protein
MTDRNVTNPEKDDEDQGMPFFWGFLVIAAVIAIAVWLFGQVELDDGSVSTTGALPITDVYI